MLSESQALAEVDFVAFDLETTGLNALLSQIVEIGAVRFSLGGEEWGRFEQLVDPHCRIPPDATRIHGITDGMVRGMPTISQVLPEFLDFLGDSSTVLLAHNARFDLEFLGFSLAKMDVPMPVHPVIDTLKLARRCIRDSPSFRLEDLAIHLGLAESEDHRAGSDARLAAGLFRESLGRIRRMSTVGDLFKFSPPSNFRRKGPVPPEPPSGYQELTVAINEQHTIVMVYEGATRRAARRRVTPRGFLQSRGRSYLRAFCHKDRIEKTYRLDRIRDWQVEVEKI